MRVVFDTSVYISAFVIYGSLAEQAFDAAVQGQVTLITSPAILTELFNKLLTKFDASDEKVINVLRQINKSARIVETTEHIDILADEPDNRILECAVAGHADLIVTGDKQILKLKNYEGIGICRVADLLHTLGEQSYNDSHGL